MVKEKLPSSKPTFTMPKLKLNALTLTRLTSTVLSSLMLVVNIRKVLILSNSERTLSMLKAPSHLNMRPFIPNRVVEIHRIKAHLDNFRRTAKYGHIALHKHLEDCATKGLNKHESQNHFCWTCLAFLALEGQEWDSTYRPIPLESCSGDCESVAEYPM